ncbi:NAD(P)/FAD-dependent oxidoreductase [Defluviimonas salinarum]|uniref:FAD-binding oxidoreductase n=1 Tax=Defluviimonas salinarum TaxID=2992147 RepID=A0ABT3IZW2_9RHOB|nr:FAD-binding oxidoreductase [Defluviimonas salinarum]MCW3780953.1 FAD-binding oxidoreductase [Defluviimonas salinarum]
MRRIYEDHGYGGGPVAGCYWGTTVERPGPGPALVGAERAEIAVIGGGYTGLSAALHLARDAGADVAVLEAEAIGWGASGRNGGFACIGGTKASEATLRRRFGDAGLAEWHGAQKEAVALVGDLIDRHGIAADVHSKGGEVVLAHRPRDLAALRAEAPELERAYGVRTELIGPGELAGEGLSGPGFHGALRLPLGFALNPLKYVLGLAHAAREAGARLYENSPVIRIEPLGDGYRLHTPDGVLEAKKLIVATNGYSSDDLPGWMAGRYLPTQSAVLVSRPLTPEEIAGQGWSSDLMAYDTRRLLHYFRLMPNRRFLFGMRGGIRADAVAQDAMHRKIRADFEAMFPAWAGIETPHYWSGFVCLSWYLTPYAGPIGDWPNAWAGFAYHGNGVAMGTYAGHLLARLATGRGAAPAVMARPPARFPLGRFRRALLTPAYAWYGFLDR